MTRSLSVGELRPRTPDVSTTAPAGCSPVSIVTDPFSTLTVTPAREAVKTRSRRGDLLVGDRPNEAGPRGPDEQQRQRKADYRSTLCCGLVPRSDDER